LSGADNCARRMLIHWSCGLLQFAKQANVN